MIAQNHANHNSSEDGELAPRPELEILGGVGGERELFMRFRAFFLSAQVSPSSTLLEASWHP